MADKSDSSTTAPGSGRVPPVKKRFDLRDFDDEDFETDGGAASGTTTDPILDLLHSMAPSGAAGSAGKV